MKSPFTNLGSNQDADSFRDQAVDREREAADWPDCPLCGRRVEFLYDGICPTCKDNLEADDGENLK